MSKGMAERKRIVDLLDAMRKSELKKENILVLIDEPYAGTVDDVAGEKIYDLGKDVEREAIIEAAIKENAKIIALSALMTTTMQEMRQVIVAAKEKSLDCKIIIGGAVITQEYADEIGADGYSKDAADAVKLAKKLLKSE